MTSKAEVLAYLLGFIFPLIIRSLATPPAGELPARFLTVPVAYLGSLLSSSSVTSLYCGCYGGGTCRSSKSNDIVYGLENTPGL